MPASIYIYIYIYIQLPRLSLIIRGYNSEKIGADLSQKKISASSPIGKGLIGKEVGEIAASLQRIDRGGTKGARQTQPRHEGDGRTVASPTATAKEIRERSVSKPTQGGRKKQSDGSQDHQGADRGASAFGQETAAISSGKNGQDENGGSQGAA